MPALRRSRLRRSLGCSASPSSRILMRRTRRTARTSTAKNEVPQRTRNTTARTPGRSNGRGSVAPRCNQDRCRRGPLGCGDPRRTDQGFYQRLKEEYAKAAGELEKSIKEQDKNKLTSIKANTSIWEPYRKKIAELGGELEKLQSTWTRSARPRRLRRSRRHSVMRRQRSPARTRS
jgi:hypothetical protein